MLLIAAEARAYLPPIDVKDGVEVRIGSFDQRPLSGPNDRTLGVTEVDSKTPCPFPVTISNMTDRTVSGTLDVWMNDDWTVSGPKGRVIVPAHGGVKLNFVGCPSARALAALYPVHALFIADGKTEGAHPIAVVSLKKSRKPSCLTPLFGIGSHLLKDDYRKAFCLEVKGKVIDLFSESQLVAGDYGCAFSSLGPVSANGRQKLGFATHPPYKKGPGTVWCDYWFSLPEGQPACFAFANMVGSERSDGVEYKVFVLRESRLPMMVYAETVRHADGWKTGHVDLSAWSGCRIGLRLWTGPGQKMDTCFDGGGWGDPIVSVGKRPVSHNESRRSRYAQLALDRARHALSGLSAPGAFVLVAGRRRFGVGVVEGDLSLVDGAIALTDGMRDLTYHGFVCEVNGMDVRKNIAPIKPIARVVVGEEGSFKVRWEMPDAVRMAQDAPRFTKLAIGPCSCSVRRAYAGFGNVIEDPKRFRLAAGGFGLSTRHVGADYRNGLSLLQATDVVPDALVCDATNGVFALEAHHDTTFTFVPSCEGAFEAARRFWKICGYQKSSGHDRLVGRICLDQWDWDNDYDKAAEEIRLAAKYGMDDAFFVNHCWQCWGYDYRLPDVYPPRGDTAAYGRMVQACKETGILFCPHDNYIDLYPDSGGFSYDYVAFNHDGTPQRAFFNRRCRAQSYCWAPHAIHLPCRRNAKLLKDNYDPDGIFIDVLAARCPFDYLDRKGTFHSNTETSRNWAGVFEDYRKAYGRSDAITVSEAGQDHLVGTLDAGQSDHFGAAKLIDSSAFGDSERIPWHDMATHNRFILLAGGIGGRYQEEQWYHGGDADLHGYASDDYLNITVLGGRNPMAEGPFGRRAVKTCWMLQDVCRELGRAELVSHSFKDNIHQQHTRFSTGAEVWSNRQTNRCWMVAGCVLPPYGFLAKAPDVGECGVILKDGQRVGYARTKDRFFVDGRLPALQCPRPQVRTSVVRTVVTGADSAKIDTNWKFLEKLDGYRPFCHVVRQTASSRNERIVFQPSVTIDAEAKEGESRRGAITLLFPASLEAGEYLVRYGLWNPKTSQRAVIEGVTKESCIDAGHVVVGKAGNKIVRLEWKPMVPDDAKERERDELLGVNRFGKAVDFGGIVTAGAVLLDCSKDGEWRISALPDSAACKVELDLAALGAKGSRVTGIEPVDVADPKVEWRQDGETVSFDFPARAYAYRLHLGF